MLKGSLFLISSIFIIPICAAALGNDTNSSLAKGTGESETAVQGRLTDAQRARVIGWMRERAPGCPPEALGAAAERFLKELSSRYPEELDRLSSDGFSLPRFESLLLQHVAASIPGPSYAALREVLALKRIGIILAGGATNDAGLSTNPNELIEKIKSASQVQHRRLLEGRIEDDDLVLLLKRTRAPAGGAATAQPQLPKVLSASDLVSEFRRRNQSGSALQRLRAYSVDALLTTAGGETQHLILSRLIPNRFRLVVKKNENTEMIIASSGHGFWQQLPNQKPVELSRTEMGTKIYLGEFINPLFNDDGYTFEKLEDAVLESLKVHRIKIRRTDGSSYVSLIDAEMFREVGREEANDMSVRYSDWREVGGVTFAFRESIKDAQGRTGVFEIQRLVPNAGLIQSYFEPSDQNQPSYFAVEAWIGRPAGAGTPAP